MLTYLLRISSLIRGARPLRPTAYSLQTHRLYAAARPPAQAAPASGKVSTFVTHHITTHLTDPGGMALPTK